VEVGLDAPVLLPISNPGLNTYHVAWQSSAGATGYRLQEARASDFVGAVTHDVGAALGYDAVDRAGGTWYYRVQAYIGAVSSAWSAPRSTTVIPDTPILNPITLTSEPDSYILTWSDEVGATGYQLYEAADVGFTSPLTRYVGSNTAYTVTGQRSGDWSYRVAAFNQAGTSSLSATRTITVPDSGVPAPMLLPVQHNGGDPTYVITVTWTSVPTATSYVLEESPSAYFEAPEIAYTGSLTQYVGTNQPIGTWSFRVRAVTSTGASPWSDSKAVYLPTYVYLPLITRGLTVPSP
jgi:hypothetical protein